MTDATPTPHPVRTLADYTAGDFQHAPTVVRLGGADAVVLSRNGADTIDVYRDGVVSALPDLTPAAEVTDPVRRETAVYAALLDIDCMRRRATEEADRQRADHRELIRLICDHTDARRRAGEACAHRSGKLLRSLGFPEPAEPIACSSTTTALPRLSSRSATCRGENDD